MVSPVVAKLAWWVLTPRKRVDYNYSMAKFAYFARNASGEKVRGILESASLHNLVATMKNQQMVVILAMASSR